MKRSLLAAVLLAACTPPRFEHYPSGSTDWMTGSFLREHAQCRTVRPNGQPDAEAPCLIYHLPPMPDAWAAILCRLNFPTAAKCKSR